MQPPYTARITGGFLSFSLYPKIPIPTARCTLKRYSYFVFIKLSNIHPSKNPKEQCNGSLKTQKREQEHNLITFVGSEMFVLVLVKSDLDNNMNN